MFKLAERRAGTGGVYCGEDGVRLEPVELVGRQGAGGYRVRPAAEIETLLASAYAAAPDAADCAAGLRRVAAYLAEGNLPLAMIAAVRLRLGEIPEDRIERLARADTLLKAGFNPDGPRDAQGRWTEEIGSNFILILDDLGNGQEGSAGSTGRNPIPTGAGGNGPAVARAWEHYPNADFRNRLAIAEQSAGHKNFGMARRTTSTTRN